MNKQSWLMRLTAFVVVLTMMIGFVGVTYSEELDVTEPAAEAPAEVTEPAPEPEAPTTKICPFCKSEIAIDAVRCPHCTSELPAEE